MKNKIGILVLLIMTLSLGKSYAVTDPCGGGLNRISDKQIICLTDQETADLIATQNSVRAFYAAQRLVQAAKDALIETDQIAVRTAKAGGNYAAATAWVTRDTQLRAIVNGAPGPIPDYPRNPDGTIAYP